MATEAARKRRKVASARIARADSPRRSSAAGLRVPSGRATRATTPKTADVSASPRKSQKKERAGRKPAGGGPEEVGEQGAACRAVHFRGQPGQSRQQHDQGQVARLREEQQGGGGREHGDGNRRAPPQPVR